MQAKDFKGEIRVPSPKYYVLGDFSIYSVKEGPSIDDGKQKPEAPGDSRYIHFQLHGIVPEPTTLGYVVQFYFDDPIETQMSIPKAFLCKPDALSTNACFNTMKRYLSEHFLNMFKLHVTGTVIGGVNINNIYYAEEPTLEQVCELFDREMVWKTAPMRTFVPDRLVYKENIVGVRAPHTNNIAYLTIFFDIAQLRF
jgi:hypothetical protein